MEEKKNNIKQREKSRIVISKLSTVYNITLF